MYVYLDWNIFNKIEQISELTGETKDLYQGIENAIISNKIITPYSNAHISDLIRGFRKNPSYIKGHLNTLARLTNNLAIVQYWGADSAEWHYREINEFFESALEEEDSIDESFEDLLGFDDTGKSKLVYDSLRNLPVPSAFKQLFKANPIFNDIYPRTKIEMNWFALCSDLYDFFMLARKDYTIYKALRTFANQSKARLKGQDKMFRDIEKSSAAIPEHLNLDEELEKYAPKTNSSKNPAYDKITNTYFKIDFKGYKSDERFANMIDDALHVFYAAHCEYFVTIDDKCHYKANETYKKLKIETKALKPKDFLTYYKAQLPTMYIQNRRDSSKLKGCSPLQLCNCLIGMKPAIAYFAYTQRWR